MGTDIKRQQALQMYPRDTSTQCLGGKFKKKKRNKKRNKLLQNFINDNLSIRAAIVAPHNKSPKYSNLRKILSSSSVFVFSFISQKGT